MADTEEQQTQVAPTEENKEQETKKEAAEETIDTDEWKLEKYRMKVVERIQDEITKTESEVPKTATELEDFVFGKAKSKRAYLDLIARILVYVAEFNRKKEEKEAAAEKAKAEEQGTAEEGEAAKEEVKEEGSADS